MGSDGGGWDPSQEVDPAMVDFRPFRAWRYNPAVVGDLASVVCPPYDLITPELQQSLLQLSPYNVVHLEAGEGLDWNAPAEGQYRQTAAVFDEWRSQDVLRREDSPSFYLLRHTFEFQGRRRTRLGLTGCVGLAPYGGGSGAAAGYDDAGQVFPHEYTEEPAVMDRVSLMRQCSANFSPIMSLYRDPEGSLTPLLQQVMSGPPVIDITADQSQGLTLWRISSSDALRQVQDFFSRTAVFLADGHHRYEAALRFQSEAGGRVANDQAAGHDYVMMTLIEFSDPGLMVLPYHRVVGGLSEPSLGQLLERLDEVFTSAPMEAAGQDVAGEMAAKVAACGLDEKVAGMIGPAGSGPQILTLRPELDWQVWGPLAVSEAWILEEQVLKLVLGESLPRHVGYIHDHGDAAKQVASGENQIAFLLKPFPMVPFEEIVRQGQRLPRKSTFFYPKLPTGLVINQLDDAL